MPIFNAYTITGRIMANTVIGYADFQGKQRIPTTVEVKVDTENSENYAELREGLALMAGLPPLVTTLYGQQHVSRVASALEHPECAFGPLLTSSDTEAQFDTGACERILADLRKFNDQAQQSLSAQMYGLYRNLQSFFTSVCTQKGHVRLEHPYKAHSGRKVYMAAQG